MHIMRKNVIFASAALLLSLATFSSGTVAATTVVNVLLEDSSSDPAIGNMRMSLDHATVTAGQVTFRAKNQSKNLIHEVIVVRIDPKKPALPYDEKRGEPLGRNFGLETGGFWCDHTQLEAWLVRAHMQPTRTLQSRNGRESFGEQVRSNGIRGVVGFRAWRSRVMSYPCASPNSIWRAGHVDPPGPMKYAVTTRMTVSQWNTCAAAP
jgi:hypothetical protein